MIELSIFEYPLSQVLAAALVLFIILRRNTSFARRAGSRKTSVVLIILASLFIAVEGTWGPCLYHHWTFVVLLLLTILSLGFTSLADMKKKSYYALMSHAGLFLVLMGGVFGSSDCTDAHIKLYSDGSEEHMAYDKCKGVTPLPFSLSLKEFKTDYYEDGTSPMQYTSTLLIDGKEHRTSVNHPCRHDGYRFYQSGFEAATGSYSIIEIVRDPWLPVVALGALLLAVSAFLNLKLTWRSWKILAAALALAVIFGLISVSRIKFGTLAPALRSMWFLPHLIVYMLAYSLMALSLIAAVASLMSDRVPVHLSGRLLSTASSLMLIGMLCGAAWAKQAWGSYWTWDPKECWAAVTWLLTLAGSHISKKRLNLLFTMLAFLSIQITWYGVNYLPSSSQSLHTYNQQT